MATGILIVLIGTSTPGHAQSCPAPSAGIPLPPIKRDGDIPVNATADSIVSEKGTVTLQGNTIIEYQGRTLSAENVRYNPQTGELIVPGQLNFIGNGIELRSSNASIDIDDEQFSAGESLYQLNVDERRGTGTASAMQGLPNGDFSLTDATYSTCPPGDNSWYVSADSLKLYPEQGYGTAQNILLVFKGVPLFALPAFSFPISDERKTGFLAPIIARGETTGFELHLPWYWNIRPDMDATFTPRFTSRRGTQLQTEVRYQNKQGLWIVDHEYLRDRLLGDSTRYLTQLQHSGEFENNGWRSEIVARRVSDKDYLEDLGDSLRVASITHLEQRANLLYDTPEVSALVRLQGFQTVDETISADDRPHAMLPQFKLTNRTEDLYLGLRGQMDSEFVYFDKDNAITGVRLDFSPSLSLPMSRDAWFFTPTISQRFTYYSLNNNRPGTQSTISRNTSTFSIDSGLFFDRQLDQHGSVQTLEPRLFYLRVPYTDQSDLPVFDSAAFDFNISQLFRNNRFSGTDRIADANQLSAALTSRVIDGSNGSERFRASFGQIYYFTDRRVNLPEQDSSNLSRSTSDFVGEFSARLGSHWLGRGSIQWSPGDSTTVRGALSLGFRPDNNRIFNLTHRVVDNESSGNATEQIDVSGLWRLNEQWRIAGRWNYSLDADQSIESLLALEYESCCWAVRIAARRFIADNGADHDTSGYLQLVLKGLAPLGQNYGALLENAVAGYRDEVR